MADSSTTRESKSDKKDILAKARADYDRAYEKERNNIELAYSDLEFLSGHEMCQWTKEDLERRGNRPTLQLNELPQFVHQITGDIRQMRPSIKVVPVDSGADEKVADLRGGLIRYIENRSDAAAVYFRAADSQVACGIGHWRIMTEYADSSTFNQEIRIAPVDDGVSVLWDPDSVLPSKEDANYCFVPVDVSRAAFEKDYPDVTPSEFDDAKWEHNSTWCTDDYVRVAEYWVKKPTKKTLALGLDGSIADVTDADESVIAHYRSKGARIEVRDSTKVCRYLITAGAVLEGPQDWPGRFIPIVAVIGEEVRVGRKIIRKGIIRDAKDAQRMVNYFQSAHAEVVALQPKAPFIGTELNFAKYQSMWEKANSEASPYLPYEPDTKNGGQAPQRVQPPVSSQGVINGLEMSLQAMKSIIGIYDPGLGNKSNETSGKAIIVRQREGDVGSYLYVDNFARAVRHTGNIINDLIPHIYDTERTIRIMGEDGKIDVLEINKANGIDPQSGETVFNHDMTVGSYDVVATVGPSFTTKREEAKDGMMTLLQAIPNAAPLILDLVAKSQDWPLADDIAKRLRTQLPQAVLAMEEAEKQGMDPEQARKQAMQQQQPPPDPKVMQVQAKAELDQQRFQFDQQKAMQDMQVEMHRMAEESKQSQSQLMAMLQKAMLDAETKVEIAQINAGVGMHKNVLDATTQQDQLELDAHDINTDAAIRAHDINTSADMARYQSDNSPQPGQEAS